MFIFANWSWKIACLPYFVYLDAAVECLLQENSNTQNKANVRFFRTNLQKLTLQNYNILGCIWKEIRNKSIHMKIQPKCAWNIDLKGRRNGKWSPPVATLFPISHFRGREPSEEGTRPVPILIMAY